jgi:hypothetical protein
MKVTPIVSTGSSPTPLSLFNRSKAANRPYKILLKLRLPVLDSSRAAPDLRL